MTYAAERTPEEQARLDAAASLLEAGPPRDPPVPRIAPGTRFGRITVIRPHSLYAQLLPRPTADSTGSPIYEVKCDCGQWETSTESALLGGRATQCPCCEAGPVVVGLVAE